MFIKQKTMKRKENLVVAIATFCVLLISCDSNDDIQCSPDFTGELIQTEEIMVGKWVLSNIVADDEIDLTDDETENPSTDIYSQFTDCQNDVFYIFSEERIMSFIVGSIAADCSDKKSSISSWKLENSILMFITSCSPFQVNIDFTTDNLAFTVESNVTFVDVNNKTVNTKVVNTYTKETN